MQTAVKSQYASEVMPRPVTPAPRRKKLRVVEPHPAIPVRTRPHPKSEPMTRRKTKSVPNPRRTPKPVPATPSNPKTMPYAQPKSRGASTSARPSRAHAQSRISSLYWVCVSVLFMATLFMLMTNLLRYNELAQIQSEIQEAEASLQTLRAEHDSIKMQLDPYLDSQRIEMLATHQLHMTKPDDRQEMVVTRDPAAFYYADDQNEVSQLAQSAP